MTLESIAEDLRARKPHKFYVDASKATEETLRALEADPDWALRGRLTSYAHSLDAECTRLRAEGHELTPAILEHAASHLRKLRDNEPMPPIREDMWGPLTPFTCRGCGKESNVGGPYCFDCMAKDATTEADRKVQPENPTEARKCSCGCFRSFHNWARPGFPAVKTVSEMISGKCDACGHPPVWM